MKPETLARRLRGRTVREGNTIVGTVVGTQYLCTDCKVRDANGRERWVATQKLTFTDPKLNEIVAQWWAERSARI